MNPHNFTQTTKAELAYLERWLIILKEESKSYAEILTRFAQSVPGKTSNNIPMSQHLFFLY